MERERGRRYETGLVELSPSEARDLNPFLETTGILGVNYCPSDIYLEPSQIPHGYARAAERLGAVMLPHTRVTGVRTTGDTVTGVHTEHGDITCDVVVDAAGAWLRAVAALTGARVPVVPTRHQLMITQPIPGVQPNQPITRVIDTNVYVRPDEGGLMLGGYEPHPVQYDAAALPAGFDIANLGTRFLRAAPPGRQRQRAASDLPARPARDRCARASRRSAHHDRRRRAYGRPAPGVRGLYIIGGCCVGGLSTSPAFGEVLAQWIVDGKPPMDLSPMAPGREAGLDEETLREACRRQYAHHYWEEVPAA